MGHTPDDRRDAPDQLAIRLVFDDDELIEATASRIDPGALFPEPPPEVRARLEAMRDVQRLPYRLALAPDPLPDDAIVVVVRDPDDSAGPIVVISEVAEDDRPYLLGRAILWADAGHVPEPAGRRVLALLPGELVRLDSGIDRYQWRRHTTRVFRVQNDVPAWRARVANVEPILVPGVGNVRLVPRPPAR
jgi:hypothetical protein